MEALLAAANKLYCTYCDGVPILLFPAPLVPSPPSRRLQFKYDIMRTVTVTVKSTLGVHARSRSNCTDDKQAAHARTHNQQPHTHRHVAGETHHEPSSPNNRWESTERLVWSHYSLRAMTEFSSSGGLARTRSDKHRA